MPLGALRLEVIRNFDNFPAPTSENKNAREGTVTNCVLTLLGELCRCRKTKMPAKAL